MASSYWQHAFPEGEKARYNFPEEMQHMLRGVRAYHAHSYKREDLPVQVAWEKGEARLLQVPGLEFKTDAPAMLLVPSLINRATILDLMQGRSLLRWLSEKGVKAYVLDWGESCADPRQQHVDDIVETRLSGAARFLYEKERQKIHALGYCMGGTLLTGAAAVSQNIFASLTLMAAPWDFHAGSQALLNRVKFWSPSALSVAAGQECLPVDWIQTLFASIDPSLTARKFARFAEMDQNSEDARLFVAVEDWLNDGVVLPGGVAQHCIVNWFLRNEPARGAWKVAGQLVRPEALSFPVFVVASSRDRLVEYDIAAALGAVVPRSKIFDPACGHIGMIAGRHSCEKVWQKILNFVRGV